MEKQLIIQYLDKKIKLFLRNKDIYSGRIEQIGETSFTILDKFNDRITISFENVVLIKECDGGRNNGKQNS
jgi:hypothetical protein